MLSMLGKLMIKPLCFVAEPLRSFSLFYIARTVLRFPSGLHLSMKVMVIMVHGPWSIYRLVLTFIYLSTATAGDVINVFMAVLIGSVSLPHISL
jgi:hypothetical protein